MKLLHQNHLFVLCTIVFSIGFLLDYIGVNSKLLDVLSLLSFAGLFIIPAASSFFIGFFINTTFLLLLPFILIRTDHLFFDPRDTKITLFMICYLFLITIINFFIMTYNAHIKRPIFEICQWIPKKSWIYKPLSQLTKWIIKFQSFFKILGIFVQYLFLLYSVIITFALIYTYLGNISNEGIEAEHEIVQNWDALYFSATTFFTVGFGDITPGQYSSLTKSIVTIQMVLGHLFTTVLWPILIIFAFSHKTNEK